MNRLGKVLVIRIETANDCERLLAAKKLVESIKFG